MTREIPVARGRAVGEDERRFTRPTDDPHVVPDRVSPVVEGYFRIPAIWVGQEPRSSDVRALNPVVHHAPVLEQRLACGITARVQRDGLFLFDFSAFPAAPITLIPGYVHPDPPYQPPKEHQAAEQSAEQIAVFRAQIMNAHQACLTTAERLVMGRGAAMGFPVNAWNTHKALRFDPPTYYDDTEDIHALARNVLNNSHGIARADPLGRRVVEVEVVRKSLELLDRVLQRDADTNVQIVEAAYISACRAVEKRFGESIVIAWAACEQLVSQAWKALIDTASSAGSKHMTRFPQSRRKKLGGRDFPASVLVEILEVQGIIDQELYDHLERARKARNRWAHDLQIPTYRDVFSCYLAVRGLLSKVRGIPLDLQTGGRGGVPQWPVWIWDSVKGDRQVR